jgi:ribosomal protein S27E
MAHFKCVACKTRQYCAARPADVVGDLCPGCGSLLEPVGELAEVFGFRHITSRENVADGGPVGRHQQIADRVDDFFARPAATVAQASLDAERWIDDGGSFSPEAVAAATPRPTPRESS